jgi:phosphohistidine phosphatase SixA
VQELAAQHKSRVMLCGHEPDLSHLVGTMLGRSMPVPMQKAMVVGLQVREGDDPKLRFILDPKSLEWSHDAR